MPGRHQVVQGRLDVQVQPAFGPPQLGRVHQRGVTAGPDGQAGGSRVARPATGPAMLVLVLVLVLIAGQLWPAGSGRPPAPRPRRVRSGPGAGRRWP